MKRVVSGLVAISLAACSADPGYEPRYEPQERPLEAQPEPPQVTTRSIEASPKLVSALQLCADKFALRLPKSAEHYAIMYDVKMDGNGTTAKVKDSMFAGTELEACLTSVLEGMEVPDSVMSTSQVSPNSRSLNGTAWALAGPVSLLPIILVAFGYTIVIGVTIYVAVEIVEAAKKWRPKPTKNRCLDAAAGGQFLWYELCRAIAITDPVKAEGCWALAEDGSEEQKRNWCNGVKF